MESVDCWKVILREKQSPMEELEHGPLYGAFMHLVLRDGSDLVVCGKGPSFTAANKELGQAVLQRLVQAGLSS